MAITKFFALVALALPVLSLPVETNDLILPPSEFNTTHEARGDPNYGFVCKPILHDGKRPSCFVQKSQGFQYGWQQKVSEILSCDLENGCDLSESFQLTATETFSINIGVSAGIDSGKGAIKGEATVGLGWSWQNSISQGTTDTFHLAKGDEGHIAFWPKLHWVCGDLAVSTASFCGRGCSPLWSVVPRDPKNKDHINIADGTACGRTPVKLDGSRPDGYVKFCRTAGPNKGQGCEQPPNPTR